MFHKNVDEANWHVRRIKWKRVYLGISWSDSSDHMRHDTFYLERKDGTAKEPEKKEPEKKEDKK